jgi:adenylate kinase family enzyme
MKRIVVIGSGGAGKSTFARELGARTGIPVIHLDRIYWKPDWQKPSEEEWRSTVAELVRGDEWIMDGNFGGTRQTRLDACDTVIFLDLSRYVCLFRVLKRAVVYRNRTRPDMAAGCTEKLDLEFLDWVWNFPKQGRVRIVKQINGLHGKRVITLRSRTEVNKFLANLDRL